MNELQAHFFLALEEGRGDIDLCLSVLTKEDMALALCFAAGTGNLAAAKILSPLVDDTKQKNQAFYLASVQGRLDIVKFFLASGSVEGDQSEVFLQALVHGHREIALLLAPLSDPKKYNHRAFFKAVEQGWTDVLDILIPKCDPNAEESLALVLACKWGDTDVVKRLLPLSDPLARNSEALAWAVVQKNQDIIDLLYPVSSPVHARGVMLKDGRHVECLEHIGHLVRQRSSEESKKNLEESLSLQKDKKPVCVRKMQL